MNTQKFLVSGIVGGIVSFLAGFLIYGLLLMDFYASNQGTATGAMKAQADFIWWALMAGCIFQGLLVSYIFNRWANITTLAAGATGGAVIGLLYSASFDLSMYGTANLLNLTSTCVDIVASTLLFALIGAAVGMMNGMGAKKEA